MLTFWCLLFVLIRQGLRVHFWHFRHLENQFHRTTFRGHNGPVGMGGLYGTFGTFGTWKISSTVRLLRILSSNVGLTLDTDSHAVRAHGGRCCDRVSGKKSRCYIEATARIQAPPAVFPVMWRLLFVLIDEDLGGDGALDSMKRQEEMCRRGCARATTTVLSRTAQPTCHFSKSNATPCVDCEVTIAYLAILLKILQTMSDGRPKKCQTFRAPVARV